MKLHTKLYNSLMGDIWLSTNYLVVLNPTGDVQTHWMLARVKNGVSDMVLRQSMRHYLENRIKNETTR